MHVNLAFAPSEDDRFFVLVETCSTEIFGVLCQVALVPFEEEDVFLRLIVEADLGQEETTRLVTAVILSVARPSACLKWFDLELTSKQHAILGFDTPQSQPLSARRADQATALGRGRTDFDHGIGDLYALMTQAPTAFVLLSGPELRFTFANPAYSRLMNRPLQEQLLGKTAREVLADLKGSRILDLMDRVMRTGVPYVGTEVLARRTRPETNELYDTYFDFTYHPICEATGRVTGLMFQVADVTERVLARQVSGSREAQLYCQWAELEAIYQTALVGLASADAKDFHILRINDQHAEVLGTQSNLARGKSLLQLSAQLPEFARLLLQAAEGVTFRNVIVREESKEGSSSRRSWLVNLAPALSASGEIAAISSVMLEVPGQAWPGTCLGDSDNLVTDVLESTTDGIFVVDRNWNIIYLNSRAKTTLPGSDRLLGRNYWEVFPASAELQLWDEYHRTMNERVPTSCTTFYPPYQRWYEIQAYPAKLGISIFFRDVTDTKLEEQALRDSEERCRLLTEVDPHLSFTMSADGSHIQFNSRLKELTGRSGEDAADAGFLQAVHPQDREQILQWTEDSREPGGSKDIEWRVLLENGQYLWLRSRFTPVIGADGEVSRYHGSSEDIDELKTLKERLRVAEMQLEELRMESKRLVHH